MSTARPSPSRRLSAARRLAPPRQHVQLCERALLLRSLDVARAGRLTLVIGPPGYGKTTALAQWHARLGGAGVQAAWYGAAEAEREPSQFLRMLALALQAGGINPGPAATRAIGDGDADAMLDAIVLGLEQQPDSVVLIVDDYDRVDNPDIAACVTELLDALPDGVHLVLAARRKPALALAMLRAMGGVRVIEPEELRLTSGELAATLALPANAPELAGVEAQTEGWPVAVQLYRLWRERAAGPGAPAPFGGHAAEVADYLAEQIVAALPDPQQRALVELSVVEYVEPALADALRARDDSAGLLAEIAAALPSLVQQASFAGEVAYRIHPLLSDYARTLLAREPGMAPLLHRRAATWLAGHDRYPDAIRHAVASKDEAFLRVLLDALPYRAVFLAYGAGELRAILREVPGGLAAKLPRMRLMSALALFKDGFFVEAEALRRQVETAIDETAADAGELRVESRALALLFATYMVGTAADAEAQAGRLLAERADDPLIRGWCENVRLVIEQERGLLDEAAASLERTRSAFTAAPGSEFGLLQLHIHELLITLARGSMRVVHERASALLRRDPAAQIGERCLHAMARMLVALVQYQRSWRPQAADEMRIALAHYGDGEAWFDQYAIALPAVIEVTGRRHGPDAALAELGRAVAEHRRRGLVCLEGMHDALALLCRMEAGGGGEVDALVEACGARLGTASAWRERELLLRALAGAARARGDLDAAAAWADMLAEEGRRGGRRGTEIKGMVLRAQARIAADDAVAADRLLGEAVLLAAEEGHVAPFAEEGKALAPALRRIAAGHPSRLAQRHAAAIGRVLEAEAQLARGDALSDREAEIVAHLADGASNKLIARRLGLTENTIKFHLKKVYAKLGVATRRQAVARAMQDR